MKKTLNVSDMANELVKVDVSFTYAGARALAEFLNDELDENTEFYANDIVAEFNEYGSATEAYVDLIGDSLEGDTEDEREEFAGRELINRTTVIRFKGGIVVQTSF